MKGLLLVNVGTPDAPEPGPVRAYLKEFLSDPYVIDLPAPLRWLLLRAVILPVRPKRSAEAYRKVWTQDGSPLLVHSFNLVSEVARRLPEGWVAQLGMRYGNPSLASALEALRAKGVEELVLFPLYPQYSTSATQTAVDYVSGWVGRNWKEVRLRQVAPFYADSGFLDLFAARARMPLEEQAAEHVLFSFHGLPERHIRRLDVGGQHCLQREDCCAQVSAVNAQCYRAQCFHTARELAKRLGLPKERYSVGFQSRLTSRWIQPFSDELVLQLPQRGVKRLLVVCPAFVADCLETVEEVGLRAKESFLAAGGESLALVPSLNAEPGWATRVVELGLSAAG